MGEDESCPTCKRSGKTPAELLRDLDAKIVEDGAHAAPGPECPQCGEPTIRQDPMPEGAGRNIYSCHRCGVDWTLTLRLPDPDFTGELRVSLDGDKWCALHGENLQEGIAGFGDTPEEAVADFAVNWECRPTRGVECPEHPGRTVVGCPFHKTRGK